MVMVRLEASHRGARVVQQHEVAHLVRNRERVRVRSRARVRLRARVSLTLTLALALTLAHPRRRPGGKEVAQREVDAVALGLAAHHHLHRGDVREMYGRCRREVAEM